MDGVGGRESGFGREVAVRAGKGVKAWGRYHGFAGR